MYAWSLGPFRASRLSRALSPYGTPRLLWALGLGSGPGKGGEYKHAGDGPKTGAIGVQGEGVQGEQRNPTPNGQTRAFSKNLKLLTDPLPCFHISNANLNK